MVEPSFAVSLVSDKFWNMQDFVKFLVDNQHQQICVKSWPEAACLQRNKVYELLDNFKFEKVTICTNNPLAEHPRYIIQRPINWLCHVFTSSNATNIPTSLHQWNLTKVFLCLFARPTAARLAIASHMYEKHLDQCHVHFSAKIDIDSREQFELDKILSYDPYYIKPVGDLIRQLPLLLGSADRYSATNGYDYSDPLTKLYRDIFVDIVVESHVSGKTFFPTEKTLRPMWLKKPFIVFASANYLEYLRQMGFRTFSDFWCEEYDGYEAGDRLSRITSVIDQLATMSHSDLEQMYWDMQYSLEHNYQLLQSQSYNLELLKLPYDG
jgi:hypothetical protein